MIRNIAYCSTIIFRSMYLELEKWNKAQVDEPIDSWVKFLREGKNLDGDNLPEYMQTKEMRQAMNTLRQFSEKERDYHKYQARMNYLREQSCLEEERNLLAQKMDQAMRERNLFAQKVDQAMQELDHVAQERDHVAQERDHVAQERDQAMQRERAAMEKLERLHKALQEAGITISKT